MQSLLGTMFAFYASTVGAWVLIQPSQFVVFAGLLGLEMLAFGTGASIMP